MSLKNTFVTNYDNVQQLESVATDISRLVSKNYVKRSENSLPQHVLLSSIFLKFWFQKIIFTTKAKGKLLKCKIPTENICFMLLL